MVGVLSVLKSGSVVPVRSAPQGITGEWRDERGRPVENPVRYLSRFAPSDHGRSRSQRTR